MKEFFALVGIIVAFVVGVIFGGYTLSVLWTWFVVSAFGVAAISVPQAMGLSLTARFLITTHPRTKKEEPWEPLFRAFAGPALVLLVGWILKHWL